MPGRSTRSPGARSRVRGRPRHGCAPRRRRRGTPVGTRWPGRRRRGSRRRRRARAASRWATVRPRRPAHGRAGWREHARLDLAAVGVAQVDVIVQVGRAGLQCHAHAVQQGDQWIGLQREALGLGVFVQGIADLGGDQAVALDLFQEVMQQRLVGAAKARLHAGLGQAGLGGAARLGVLEQPALEVRARARPAPCRRGSRRPACGRMFCPAMTCVCSLEA